MVVDEKEDEEVVMVLGVMAALVLHMWTQLGY